MNNINKVNLNQKLITREILKTTSSITWVYWSTSHGGSTGRPKPPPNSSLTLYLFISIHKTRPYGDLIFSWWLALGCRSFQWIPLLILKEEYELGFQDSSSEGQGSDYIAWWDEHELLHQTKLRHNLDASLKVVEEACRSRRWERAGPASPLWRPFGLIISVLSSFAFESLPTYIWWNNLLFYLTNRSSLAVSWIYFAENNNSPKLMESISLQHKPLLVI